MGTTERQQVLLLKTKSYPTDPYDVLLRSKQADPIFVPVLEHRHVNLDTISHIISKGLIDGFRTTGAQEAEYGGLIITSQRAVEALGAVLELLKDTVQPITATHPIYVVGPATEKSIVDLGFPASNVYGAHCGNGQMLADFMLGHYKSNKKLLFLVGEIRRDVITKTLNTGGVGVDEIVIYDTQVVNSFEEDLARTLKLGEAERTRGKDSGEQAPRWVVIFSPTGSGTAMEILGRKDPVQSSLKVPHLERKTYVATIGPTTASHLRDAFGVEPDVVAVTPSPQGLWSGFEQFLEVQRVESRLGSDPFKVEGGIE
ncbi:tetrapyrrole biosynthesis, uroporphyrinogen III synthase [Terfezia boudieri ATCC MYA-4762]|uniref:Tetrapyrrole biosynthesis, uroporphyrinogen III synthase n=1 Tax=Terfezia boudieri ATCC MYA-4762 TaxID=1051890 RepID=A0A3N4M0I2_9PEZI|nr:tetrapyrrole biosynthesis, uroporphyrinogen III synthase [Terfezia boudieri ATCC MYA-4762]